MEDFKTKLAKFSSDFNDKLPSIFNFPNGEERRVVDAMFYSVSNGGKRLRPFLVTTTAKLLGISESQSFITAAALECLHSYSLIHDDLPAMDNDDLRRGNPTCHKQFDEATAILAGDGLLTYAFELISSERNEFSSEIIEGNFLVLVSGHGFTLWPSYTHRKTPARSRRNRESSPRRGS